MINKTYKRFFSRGIHNSAEDLATTVRIVDYLKTFVQSALYFIPNITRKPVIRRYDPLKDYPIVKKAQLVEHLGNRTFAVAANERIDIHDLSASLQIRCSMLVPGMTIKKMGQIGDHLIVVGTVHSENQHDIHVLKVFNWRSGKLLRGLSSENGNVWLFVGTAGPYVVGCTDHQIVFWEIDEVGIKQVKGIVIDYYPRGTSFQVLPDGSIALDCGNGEIHVWDITSGTRKAVLRGHVGDIYAMCITKDGSRLLATGEDRLITQYEIATCTCLGSFPTLCDDPMNRIWSLGRKYVLAASVGEVNIYDINTGKLVENALLGGPEENVIMLPTSELVTIGRNLSIFGKIENKKKGKQEEILKMHIS
jgi:hypothetical protein